MSEDDRALMDRLAALEAEVKADAEVKQQRKDAALAKLREQKAERDVERTEQRERAQAAAPRSRKRDAEDFGTAIELASKANGVRQELARTPKAGDKSWVKSTLASALLGPVGWLYAGSFREAVPAAAGYVVLGTLAAKILPWILLMPVMIIALPLSGLAGLMYALQYNRAGKRTRLFGDAAKKQKLLP